MLYTIDALDAEPTVAARPEHALGGRHRGAGGPGAVSHDGKPCSPTALAAAGSDWQEWRVRDVDTGRDRDDELSWIKFSGASWTKDGKGFYYSRFPEPKPGEDLKGANYHQKLYFHALGTPQADDVLVYERPDQKEWQFHGTVTDDGRYLIITVSKGTDDKYRILYKTSIEAGTQPVELIDNFDARVHVHRQRRPRLLVQDRPSTPRAAA